ncbi:MAG: LamG-like jellyroll fold domain-containing protein [Gammaproteobacteria bacterium]
MNISRLLAACIFVLCGASAVAQVDWSARSQVGTRGTGVVGTGDINADGINDVAIAINNGFVWYPGPNFSADDETRIGDGSGSSYGGTMADINGDGWPDLVAADGARNSGPGRLWLFVHPGSAAAASEPWQRIEIWSQDVWHQNDLDVADLDGDGRLDVVVRTRSDALRVLVALQNDDLTNWTTRAWPTGETNNAPEGIGVGDVDNDGETEIVLSGVYWDNPGGWRAGDPIEYSIDPAFVGQAIKAVVADLDQDGQADDIVMSKAEGSQDIFLAWYRLDGSPGDGASAWTRTLLLDNVSAMHALEVADIDQDGHNDIYAGNSFSESGLFVFYGSDSGNVWTAQTIDAGGKQYVASLADLDGDGDLDIVGPATWQGDVFVYTNLLFTDGGPTEVPAAPDQLVATATSDTAIQLVWSDNADNETRTVVERRAQAQGAFAPIAELGANVVSFADNGLVATTTYEYRVLASNVIGVSPYSNVAQATTFDPPPPDTEAPSVPGAPVVVSASFSSVTLSWTPSTDNVGVAGYTVLRDGIPDGTTSSASYVASGLMPSSNYDFSLRAFDTAGNVSVVSPQVNVQTGAAPDLADALVAYYRLDETAGTQATDVTGAYPGVLRGAPVWQPGSGRYGGALKLAGGNDGVDVGTMDIVGDQLSITAWVYLDSVSGIASEARFVSKASGSIDQQHVWMLGNYLDGSALRFRLRTDNGGTTTLISPTGVLPLSQWVHVAAIYDSSAMHLYVDGVQVASGAKSGSVAIDPTVAVALGNQPAGLDGRGLVGQLDEVGLFTTALNDDQLALVMAGLPAPDCASSSSDCDQDGVAASDDNCTSVANANQSDGDGDGFGNACDADLNNDCVTNVVDLGLLRSVFFLADAAADLNDDGVVNVIDLGLMRAAFFTPPGPSGLTTSCGAP